MVAPYGPSVRRALGRPTVSGYTSVQVSVAGQTPIALVGYSKPHGRTCGVRLQQQTVASAEWLRLCC
jgi:hypothetical protein